MNKRTLILGMVIAVPFVAIAQSDTGSGLVKCGVKDEGGVLASNQCGYEQLFTLIKDVLNYAIYKIATPIATLMFAFAGFKLLTSGGDMTARKTAQKIFTNVMYGYGIMLAAFLIIKLIFSFLFPEDFSLLN